MRSALEAWWRWLRIRTRQARRDWLRPKGGPAGRLRRRLAFAGVALAAVSAALAFPDSLGRRARSLCMASSTLADACGRLGIPGVPDRAERLAWEAVSAGNCEALRAYKASFPGGAFREEADRQLAIVRTERSPRWTPFRRETTGFIPRRSAPLPSEAEAVADARGQVAADAAELGCRPVDEHERLVRIEILSAVPRCRGGGEAYTCALDYRAVCRMEERRLVEICG